MVTLVFHCLISLVMQPMFLIESNGISQGHRRIRGGGNGLTIHLKLVQTDVETASSNSELLKVQKSLSKQCLESNLTWFEVICIQHRCKRRFNSVESNPAL